MALCPHWDSNRDWADLKICDEQELGARITIRRAAAVITD